MPHGALIVVGSGPGVGSHVAATFARQGFRRVVLMSRNVERLSDDAVIIRSVSPSTTIDIIPVDLIHGQHIEDSLEDAHERLGDTPVECIFFNAARIGESRLLAWPVESLQDDLQVSVVSLYTVIRWGMPQLLDLAHREGYKPTLLVTSGAMYRDPQPQLFSIAACRAAQHNLMASCSKEFGPQGVHCGVIDIEHDMEGVFPVCNAQTVAEQAWEAYNQPNSHDANARSVSDQVADQR